MRLIFGGIDTQNIITIYRIISVAGLSYLWPKSAIPYDDLVWKDTPWDPLAAYGQSNLARILFTRELARQAKVNGDQFSSYARRILLLEVFSHARNVQVDKLIQKWTLMGGII